MMMMMLMMMMRSTEIETNSLRTRRRLVSAVVVSGGSPDSPAPVCVHCGRAPVCLLVDDSGAVLCTILHRRRYGVVSLDGRGGADVALVALVVTAVLVDGDDITCVKLC
jgi:hypothetical protein